MTLNSTTFIQRGLLIEALLTAELVLISLMLAKERHRATFLAPVGIGLTLFIAPLVGILYTRGPLLSARSFSPWVVTSQFGKEHWIYWVEPLIDIFIALAFYKFIKVSGYELVNPDQDADNWNSPTKSEHCYTGGQKCAKVIRSGPDHELRERQTKLATKVLHSLNIGHSARQHREDYPEQADTEASLETAKPLEEVDRALWPLVQGVITCDPVSCRIE
ncbi:MAG: hypothetical protein Q9157_004830 [Trypethelium eluteriae]